MPKTVDIVIGVSLVMLIVSLVVTAMTEFVLTVLNSRGRNLMSGLAGLLRQIDPTLSETLANDVAKGVLTHPLISGKAGRPGTVVHREEFTKLLMDLASAD